jgi:chemotaxis protein methyltransferase CheR/type IV pilus assembly protein PilK
MVVQQDKLPGSPRDGYESMPEMDDGQYARWKDLLEKRTGMILSDERRTFLLTNVSIRMRELGYRDFQEYYDHVLNGPTGAIEWTTLVDRLTVHETRFFRHQKSIRFLREVVLPEWLESGGNKLNIWSVGCATGEEPYTLAMVVDHYVRRRRPEYLLGMLASDISLASLATGRQAIYDQRKLTEMDQDIFNKYLTKVDERRYQVKEELRKRVCFMQLNVLEMDDVPVGKMHLIFCQNLLIYFNREKRIKILDNLDKHLSPGGYLILGSGEILGWKPEGMEKINYENTLVFRKQQEATA